MYKSQCQIIILILTFKPISRIARYARYAKHVYNSNLYNPSTKIYYFQCILPKID